MISGGTTAFSCIGGFVTGHFPWRLKYVHFEASVNFGWALQIGAWIRIIFMSHLFEDSPRREKKPLLFDKAEPAGLGHLLEL